MSAHAKFAPSKAHRWIPCPGSLALEPEAGDTGSDFADEGTAAHFWASAALEYGKDAKFYLGATVQPRVGGKVFTCDEAFVLNIQVYLDDVRSRIAGGTLLVEQHLTFSESIGQPEQFGTGDAVIITDDGATLIVEDLKYGQGVQVYADDNEQLMLYALGALEKYEPILGDSVQRVRGVICQPRLDHIDEHEWTVQELREFAEKAKEAARRAVWAIEFADMHGTDALEKHTGVAADKLFNPGEKQCRFCPVKATCVALERQVSEAVYDDFSVIGDPDKALTVGAPPIPGPKRLSAAFGLLDQIEGWCRSVRGEVERQVMGGMEVIGPDGLPMKIIEGKKGNRAWQEGAEETVAGLLCTMGKIGPNKAYKPREIITPAVADKLLGKKGKVSAPEFAVLVPYITQADGRPKVVLGSNPAPAFEPSASASEFSNVETEME